MLHIDKYLNVSSFFLLISSGLELWLLNILQQKTKLKQIYTKLLNLADNYF